MGWECQPERHCKQVGRLAGRQLWPCFSLVVTPGVGPPVVELSCSSHSRLPPLHTHACPRCLPLPRPGLPCPPAVALVLGFVGVKILADFAGYQVPTDVSLGVVAALLGGGVGASLLLPAPQEE